MSSRAEPASIWAEPAASTRIAPPLPHRPVTFHRQRDVASVVWPLDADVAATLVPAGTRPDLLDGSAWLTLTGYVFADSTVPPLPPLGRLGTMTELAVQIATVDQAGHRGSSYLAIDTQHAPAVAAARIGIGLPYVWSHAGSRRFGDAVAHRSKRRRMLGAGRNPASAGLRILPGDRADESDGVVAFLRDRWGVHARHVGRTSWWRFSHEPWVMHDAVLLELDDDLVRMLVGHPVSLGTPQRVLFAAGSDVEYSRG